MNNKIIKRTTTTKLVISKDLNHHGTLFAGTVSNWFVESSFLCAAKNTKSPESVVCLKINEFTLMRPGKKGDVLDFESDIIKTGNSSFVVYTSLINALTNEQIGYGAITFVTIDKKGKPIPHGLTLYDRDNKLAYIGNQ